MNYKYNVKHEEIKYSHEYIISQESYDLIPDDYKSSWIETDYSVTHQIKNLDPSSKGVYAITPVDKKILDVSQKSTDKRDWFKKR